MKKKSPIRRMIGVVHHFLHSSPAEPESPYSPVLGYYVRVPRPTVDAIAGAIKEPIVGQGLLKDNTKDKREDKREEIDDPIGELMEGKIDDGYIRVVMTSKVIDRIEKIQGMDAALYLIKVGFQQGSVKGSQRDIRNGIANQMSAHLSEDGAFPVMAFPARDLPIFYLCGDGEKEPLTYEFVVT